MFPWIRTGRGASAGGPIRVMQHEHRQAELYLQRLRHLADATQRSGSVDDVVADLMQRLAALDASLRDHIELEELMFLRVLAGFRAFGPASSVAGAGVWPSAAHSR